MSDDWIPGPIASVVLAIVGVAVVAILESEKLKAIERKEAAKRGALIGQEQLWEDYKMRLSMASSVEPSPTLLL